MHRDSAKSISQAELLRAHGVKNVPPRRLERWSQAGRLPTDDVDPQRFVEHCRALAEVMGRGKPAERASVILAARGFECPCLRDDLARAMGCTSATELANELTQQIDDSTSAGFATIESYAYAIEVAVERPLSPGPPPVVLDFTRWLLQRVENGTAFMPDLATKQPPTPEQARHSFITNQVAMGRGQLGAYDFSFVFALAGVSPNPAQRAAVQDAAERISGGISIDAERAIVAAPLRMLVAMAVVAREVLGILVDSIGCPPVMDADDRDYFAGLYAPTLIGVVLAMDPDDRAEVLRQMTDLVNKTPTPGVPVHESLLGGLNSADFVLLSGSTSTRASTASLRQPCT